MKKTLRYSLVLYFFTISMFAQKTWKQTTISTKQETKLIERDIPLSAKVFSLNMDALKSKLKSAPQRGNFEGKSSTIIELPNADGKLIQYRVEEASVFAPELQEKYPEIRSYAGYALEDASTYLRFTISPYNGINGIVLKGNRSETEVIEVLPGDTSKALIFKRSDRTNIQNPYECTTKDDDSHITIDGDVSNRAADDSKLRTFDLAMSVTGEYSTFHGGTLASVNAAIATTVARQNSVYEIDFAITLVLIASNDNVVFLDAATDPYGNTDANYNSELQVALDQAPPTGVGSAAYDVGHLMSAIGNNGNAGCIGCICVAGQKGSGYTTSTSPVGDNFDIDFVAHEMGHQFGGRHTFTHSSEGAGIAQMEPGSGSTIMGYAGITGATDVQAHSDPYFHAISIQQITAHAKSRACDVETPTGNNIPVVNAGADLILPIGTPFKLIGSATDADGADVLTYCWEQYNENDAANDFPSETSTDNNRPLYRSYNPTTSPIRTFPKMEDLLANGINGSTWEKVPTVGRTADFRLTVRDNRAGGAGNSFDDMLVTWDATKGPLEVTSQGTSGIVWSGGTTENITWNVNNTNTMTGAANVDILLSTDGGLTYPMTLASNVPNDGTETITVPSTPAPYCRIMVQPTGAQFFAINTMDFAIDYLVQTTCEVFTSSPNVNILDNQSSFSTDGLTSTSTKTFGGGVFLKVGLDVTHTYIGDLRFNILSPAGTQLKVFNQSCGTDEGINALFFDSGSSIVCASPTVGNIIPVDAFSALDGQSASGTWTLGYVDLAAGDIGTLNTWSIEVCETIVTSLAVENNDFTLFGVYPNPSNGKVKINLSTIDDVKVSLFDISGRLIYSKLHSNNNGTFSKEINFGNVSTGVYFLNVISNNKKAVKKLVIQ